MTESPRRLAARTRAFHQKIGAELREIEGRLARARAYRGALAQAGLAGLTYPVELGGQGLTLEHERAFLAASEGLRPDEDQVFALGLGTAMPTIRDHGSPELQRRFVPPGLSGEEIWCQLYSEPGAGSDLAGLVTRADRDGDEWVVTGQKVWTSGAHYSDMAILLARTAPDLPKHRGITMFVLPMDQPGVTVRPLVMMTGAAEFSEVFLDEARIPAHWVIGQVNDGWSLAVALLAQERAFLGAGRVTSHEQRSKTGRSPLPYDGLLRRARCAGRADDPVIRQELAEVFIGERLIGWLRAGGVHPSIAKLWRTRQGRRAAQLAHQLGGPGATAWEDDDVDRDYFAYHVLNCRGMSLGGGTDQIQRNTLGERVLDLPREPRTDRDVAFRDLPRN